MFHPYREALFVRTGIKIAAALPLAALTLSLAACGSDSESGKDKAERGEPLVVAASPTPHADILRWVEKNLAPKAGLKLEVKEFSDYVQPNTAVQDGSADANYFQHVPYLKQFNKDKGTELRSVAKVHLELMGVYSEKAKKLGELKSGATVAVPKDPTNEGRALKLLADSGLIKLKSGSGLTATPKDITSNPKKLKITEQDAATLPRTLDSVDAAVINGNYAIGAKQARSGAGEVEGQPLRRLRQHHRGEGRQPEGPEGEEARQAAELGRVEEAPGDDLQRCGRPVLLRTLPW
jgi:D-methionine transport system substrate-binding protein